MSAKVGVEVETAGEITQQSLADVFLSLDPDKGKEKGDAIRSHFGGIPELAHRLGSDVQDGIREGDDTEKRRKAFGENFFATPPLASYCDLYMGAFEDPVLQVLCGAVFISVIVGTIENQEHGWAEGVAIFMSIQFVANITAISDYRKQLQFEALFKKGDLQDVTVVRAAKIQQVDKSELMVGDLVVLKTGDKVPADGVICPGTAEDLTINEADLTGESVPLEKKDNEDVYVHADTFVVTGTAQILIVAVGKDTLTGKIKEELMEKEDQETPLQMKLGRMAELIGYAGTFMAVVTFIAALIVGLKNGGSTGTTIVNAFIIGVTIIVVAVPEGLPLAVTIALAYSMAAMFEDNIFVKVLSACETMGGATCIASDKTGTLTQGIMTVTGVWAGGETFESETKGSGCKPSLKGKLLELFCRGIAVNSDAQVTHEALTPEQLEKRIASDTSTTMIKRVGNFTECALLTMLDELTGNAEYLKIRKSVETKKLKVKAWPFDSAKKRMSIIVKTEDGQGEQLFLKGAGEQVLGLCSKYMTADGSEAPLNDVLRESLEVYRAGKAREGFRLICLAYKQLTPGSTYTTCPDTELTMLGFTSILDPLREEVPEAVRICKEAGVRVIMVTGDHKDTAQYIAGQCGIYVEADKGVVLEAHEFRQMYDQAFLAHHGSRLQRYCQETEKIVNGEPHITLSPYLDDHGDELDWRKTVGPICSKPVKIVMPGQKEKADDYTGFKGNLVRGNPQQLDAWAYGVRNVYDDARWPSPVQASVEELRVKTVKVILEDDNEKKCKLLDELHDLIKEFMKTNAPADAVAAVEKFGHLAVPPADFRDLANMALDDKAREKIDGGAISRKLWQKLDGKLFHFQDGIKQRTGGLQVMARSLPNDKLKLVRRLMKCDEIVGVTGDGTNDAPALRNANIGLAMGSGTQVARDAAAITILDDNFVSIVLAIKWGRNIFDSIRKFLQFQLTVNVVALTVTFVSACVGRSLPLNAVMLLWVNLIMDSMGALALATEKPTDALLKRPPHGKQRLLSISMIRMNICQAAYQLIVLFILSSPLSFIQTLCTGPGMLNTDVSRGDCQPAVTNTTGSGWNGDTCIYRQNTLIFNSFVFCQIFNEINCRKLKEFNVFENFFISPTFIFVIIFTTCLQFFMVEVPHAEHFIGTNGLTWQQWITSIIIGSMSLPVGFLARLINVDSLEATYDHGPDVGDDEEEDAEDAPAGDLVSALQKNDGQEGALPVERAFDKVPEVLK